MNTEINSRYQAYLDVHGCTLEQMRVRAKQESPGSPLRGYLTWIRERWQEWRRLKGYGSMALISQDDHAEFDVWLADFVSNARAQQGATT